MNKIPVGIQLYGLRDVLEDQPASFKKVMTEVKGMGYDGVELAGLYGLEPEYIRDVLGEIGLIPISAHVPFVDMLHNLDKVIRDYTIIGVQYIIVPYLTKEYRHKTPGYSVAIETMRNVGQFFKEYGIKLGYHNHDFEFVTLPDGTLGFDDIFARVDEGILKIEPDTCWIKASGHDPVAYIRKYGNRCEIVHLKDFVLFGGATETGSINLEFRPVGFGQQLWEPVLAATLDAGSKWIIIEQDESYNISSLEASRRSREYLKILGW